jgi:hypothetical protein
VSEGRASSILALKALGVVCAGCIALLIATLAQHCSWDMRWHGEGMFSSPGCNQYARLIACLPACLHACMPDCSLAPRSCPASFVIPLPPLQPWVQSAVSASGPSLSPDADMPSHHHFCFYLLSIHMFAATTNGCCLQSGYLLAD